MIFIPEPMGGVKAAPVGPECELVEKDGVY